MAKSSPVGELVRARRTALRIRSQQRLAELVGVDRSHIAKIESGAIALPQPELRRRLAEALGLGERDFLVAAGILEDEPAEYGVADDPDEDRLRFLLRGLPAEDRTLLVDFAELLDRRRRGRRD